MTLAGFRL